jgi:hypothetical protein
MRAIEQARSREPAVKAMALLCSARVLAALDKDEARRSSRKACRRPRACRSMRNG